MINIGDTFDDVLISPSFSMIETRKAVSVKGDFLGLGILPIISSNMDTVTDARMAAAMAKSGCIGALHRFNTIEENVEEYSAAVDLMVQSGGPVVAPIGSIGIGEVEYQRALALAQVGCKVLLIDVAHGAAIHVVKQYDRVRKALPYDVKIIVGNFSDADGIRQFNYHSDCEKKPDAYKVGIGGGSMCLTRIVTGCGVPTLGSVADCVRTGFPIIADGGIRNSGDIAKSFAAGASAVMVGSLLAGTEESPGEVCDKYGVALNEGGDKRFTWFKKYRGSASAESYDVQGKTASHRAPEGDSTLVRCKGPVSKVIETLEGGLRSALTYVGASNLGEFKEFARFIKVSQNSVKESVAHGKN